MAGTNDAFAADEFRTSIRDAMLMGLTGAVADRPTFIFNSTESYPVGTPVDDSGMPFDLTLDPTVTQTASKQVLCAVQWASGASTSPAGNRVGDFEEADLVITLLDQEYALIEGADQVEVDGTRYEIRFAQPSTGLFDVTVHQLHCFTYNQR